MNDRIIGKLFADAKRKHKESFHNKGKSINEKVRLYTRVGNALIEARKNDTDVRARHTMRAEHPRMFSKNNAQNQSTISYISLLV
ncbi:hypothetical protein REG_1854 [Candidatus Regiella insecticola LSR1]|uniref:Uncharacterized protein n=1 Tax=Candidatus Regiella insecticola LSR1 TaxID=663321 RepID=E0WUR9_9ENTR|nr:hypothetical protein REG_1854 [Candidatus Regiella insecticola LSR1]